MGSGKKVDSPKSFRDAGPKSGLTDGELGSQAQPRQPSRCCPECGSERLWKDGLRYPRSSQDRPVQRYLCRLCGLRFSESTGDSRVKGNVGRQGIEGSDPRKRGTNNTVLEGEVPVQNPLQELPFSTGEYVGSHDASNIGERLNILRSCNRRRQVCVSEREAKNLASITETRQEVGQREATAKGKIIEYAWHMKKNGRADATIRTYTILLSSLIQQGANLTDPESVKEAIAIRRVSDRTKKIIVDAYKGFAELYGIAWKPPKYKGKAKIPFIPLEREIDDLIACCSKKTAALLRLLKETGARLGEALELKWTDLDVERRVVRIEPEKGSDPRALKISEKCLSMLNALAKTDVRIFGGRAFQAGFQESLYRFRRKAAAKL